MRGSPRITFSGSASAVVAAISVARAAFASASPGLNVIVDDSSSASFSLAVDGRVWFRGGGTPPSVRGHGALELQDFEGGTAGSDKWGAYEKSTWWWGTKEMIEDEVGGSGDDSDAAGGRSRSDSDTVPPVLLSTDVRVYRDREMVVFTQSWPSGLEGSGESRTNAASVPFLASFPSFDTTPAVAPSARDIEDGIQLSYLGWGGCFAADIRSGPWDASSLPEFDGATSGVPLLWHDEAGRSVVLSPMNNFFVAGQALDPNISATSSEASSPPRLECGVRGTVSSLPAGFSHSTVLVGGRGISNTLMAWGDHLLSIGGKERTDPYGDFVLSHLGYWTDNGAFYYHVNEGFDNEEQALRAVKADLLSRDIPVRYFQWDDWWMESEGDIPGITSWVPRKSVFPSGFTDWLQLPLALYAPNYAEDNVWREDYTWKVDDVKGKSAIPLDPNFYVDLFANGTSIGIKMFEQDFLCTMNTDMSVTNGDVDSGRIWMEQMDAAARAAGVTLQWCMMNAAHALQSTLVKAMTNGRATGDNCREGPRNIEPMGQTGLLFWSLGFLPSRDNVWTSPPDAIQDGCNRANCAEESAAADSAAALLGGGPYGPADKVGYADRTIIMRAARDDGVLLRPSWPLTSLDAPFLRRARAATTRRRGDSPPGGPVSADGSDSGAPPLVWAAHDDHDGVGRWSYVAGINLMEPFSLTPDDLLVGLPQQSLDYNRYGSDDEAMIAWPVNFDGADCEAPGNVTRFDSSNPLNIPAAPPKKTGPGASLWVAAPILPNGAVLLGEVSKWATMSKRRFQDVNAVISGESLLRVAAQDVIISATVIGAPGERVAVSYILPPSSSADGKGGEPGTVSCIKCIFPASGPACGSRDRHGDIDCRMLISCTMLGCKCGTDGMISSEGIERTQL